jgi:hypothetical protein
MSATDTARLQHMLNCAEITELLQGWGHWRDDKNWDKLAAAYTPQGHMTVSWFSGPMTDFIAQSIVRSKSSRLRGMHFMGPSTIDINRHRAVSETRAILVVRGIIDEVEVDVTAYVRFLDRLLQDARWQIASRHSAYERDRLDVVQPGTVPKIDATRLAQFPDGCRYLGYLTVPQGTNSPAPSMLTVGSSAFRVLREDAANWLAQE